MKLERSLFLEVVRHSPLVSVDPIVRDPDPHTKACFESEGGRAGGRPAG